MTLIAIYIMTILILSILCQWLAWKTKIPSILFLLSVGLFVGPISSYLSYDSTPLIDPLSFISTDLFYTFVELSVAIILFEGCMTLNFKDLKGSGMIVRNLVTFGFLITVSLTVLISYYICGFSWTLSFLLGGVTAVSGPTVVAPILKSVMPNEKISQIIRWEGMLIDPVGALAAALIFTTISSSTHDEAVLQVIGSLIGVIALGTILGLLFGYMLGNTIKKHLLPEYLNNLFVLVCVVSCFVIADSLLKGAGLLAVTIMGVYIANIKNIHLEEILNFKESLSLLLISILFITLSASIVMDNIDNLIIPGIILVACLQFIVRPISVLFCTFDSSLSVREKILLSWIMPRGIVAAAVAALISIKLTRVSGYEEIGHTLQIMTFLIIIGTVTFQSLTAPYIAKLTKTRLPDPHGFLIVGANLLARSVALELINNGIQVILADTVRRNVQQANLAGLNVYYGNPCSKNAEDYLNLAGIGNLIALSSDDSINTLSAVKFSKIFGKVSVFMLANIDQKDSHDLMNIDKKHSRVLFTDKYNYEDLKSMMHHDAVLKTTKITESFTWNDFKEKNIETIPLFIISNKGIVTPITPDEDFTNDVEFKVISLSQ